MTLSEWLNENTIYSEAVLRLEDGREPQIYEDRYYSAQVLSVKSTNGICAVLTIKAKGE